MRVPISGVNDEALTTPASDAREIISGEDFDGDAVSFWLRGMSIGNEHATETGTVELYDSDEGAGPGAATQRGVYLCPPNSTTVFDFSYPGIKFTTNITAGLTNGTVNAYAVVAWGVKES